MADKNPRKNPTTDALFGAILSLETREECYNFFEDLCTVKEISDMASGWKRRSFCSAAVPTTRS